MRNYWSCSKLASIIRGTPKPRAATREEWRKWRTEAKQKSPIRYWIAEKGLNMIQSILRWIPDKLHAVKYYLVNRYISKTHALTSTLKRGSWHEFETRALYSLFDSFIDFVEIEQAWSHIAWSKEARKKYNPPSWACGWWKLNTWRCPEAGLEHLKWASQLTNANFLPDDKKHLAKPTGQAKTAIEELELYNWWKNVRPNRPDPSEVSGWDELYNSGSYNRDHNKRTEEQNKQIKRALRINRIVERRYAREDQQMMIRLIKIREGLWT